MYVTKWSPNLRQDEDSPVVPVWISFPHLPIHLHEQRALFNIASMLGTPLKVDQATLNFTRPKYARVCVEVDVSKPLHQRIHIKHVDEDLFFQVQYEDPPVFCNSCRKLGHNLHSCKLAKPMVREPLKDQEIHKVHDKNPAAVLDGWTTVQRKGKAPVNPPARRENRREDTSNKVPQKTWVPKPIIDYSQLETSKRGEHRGPTFIQSTTTLFLEPSGLVHSHLPLHAEVHEAVPVANSESTAIQPIPLEDTSEADIPLEDTSEEDIPLKMTSSSAPPSPKAKSHTSKVCTRSVQEAEKEASKAEMDYENDPSEHNREIANLKQAQLIQIGNKEHCFWKKKCNLKWFKDGDANSSFFHSLVKDRRRHQRIHSLKDDDGQTQNDPLVLESMVISYYHNLFNNTEPPPAEDTYEDFLSSIPTIIDQNQNQFLMRLPTEEEVKNNLSICLSTVASEIATKCIANRLRQLLPLIISEEQGAFVPGREISDQILITKEMAHNMDRKAEGGNIIIKLDMTKAFDKVKWSYLLDILQKFGFCRSFLHMVKTVLKTSKYSVLFNEKPCGFFGQSRGIKQGDPLSPLLFIIANEGFSRNINKLFMNGVLGSFLFILEKSSIPLLPKLVCNDARNDVAQMSIMFPKSSFFPPVCEVASDTMVDCPSSMEVAISHSQNLPGPRDVCCAGLFGRDEEARIKSRGESGSPCFSPRLGLKLLVGIPLTMTEMNGDSKEELLESLGAIFLNAVPISFIEVSIKTIWSGCTVRIHGPDCTFDFIHIRKGSKIGVIFMGYKDRDVIQKLGVQSGGEGASREGRGDEAAVDNAEIKVLNTIKARPVIAFVMIKGRDDVEVTTNNPGGISGLASCMQIIPQRFSVSSGEFAINSSNEDRVIVEGEIGVDCLGLVRVGNVGSSFGSMMAQKDIGFPAMYGLYPSLVGQFSFSFEANGHLPIDGYNLPIAGWEVDFQIRKESTLNDFQRSCLPIDGLHIPLLGSHRWDTFPIAG
ncbi:unnamed protein product [Cuscuta campestris]|uniref:Reverse transcriptase domain-containing protein n=1 Tax=Cuscuta campestris TaxID=132261 RepID=A0A484LUR2_9ASTE|nr:unnamed protein product [Cuscuta campestris]